MRVSPLIRVLMFAVYAVLLAAYPTTGLLMLGLAIAVVSAVYKIELFAGLFARVLRLKWFWISILLFYFWFSDGELLWTAWPLAPTFEGIQQGSRRAGVLLVLLGGAHLLLRSISFPQWLGVFYGLTMPFSVWPEFRLRLLLRLGLTLSLAQGMDQGSFTSSPKGSKQPWRIRLNLLVLRTQVLFSQALEQAQRADTQPISLIIPKLPRWYEWVCLVFVVGIFESAAHLGPWI